MLDAWAAGDAISVTICDTIGVEERQTCLVCRVSLKKRPQPAKVCVRYPELFWQKVVATKVLQRCRVMACGRGLATEHSIWDWKSLLQIMIVCLNCVCACQCNRDWVACQLLWSSHDTCARIFLPGAPEEQDSPLLAPGAQVDMSCQVRHFGMLWLPSAPNILQLISPPWPSL